MALAKQYEKCFVRVSPMRMTHSTSGMMAFMKKAKAQYTDRSQIAEDVLWKAFCKENKDDKRSSNKQSILSTKAMFRHVFEKIFQRNVHVTEEQASAQSTTKRVTRRILSDMSPEKIGNSYKSIPQRDDTPEHPANIGNSKNIKRTRSQDSEIVNKYTSKKTRNAKHPFLSAEPNNLSGLNTSSDETQHEGSLLKSVRRLCPKTKAFLDSSSEVINTAKHTATTKVTGADVHDKRPPARRTTLRLERLSSSDEMDTNSKRKMKSDGHRGGPTVRQRENVTRTSIRKNPQNVVKTVMEAPERYPVEMASESDDSSEEADMASKMTTRRSALKNCEYVAAGSRSSEESASKMAADKDEKISGRRVKYGSYSKSPIDPGQVMMNQGEDEPSNNGRVARKSKNPDRKNVEESESEKLVVRQSVTSPTRRVTRKTIKDRNSSKMVLTTSENNSDSDTEECEQPLRKPELSVKKPDKKQKSSSFYKEKLSAKISADSGNEDIPEVSSDNIQSSSKEMKELRKTYPMRSSRNDTRRYCPTNEESSASQTTPEKSTSKVSKLKPDLGEKENGISCSKHSVIGKSPKKVAIEDSEEYLSTSSSKESDNESDSDISHYLEKKLKSKSSNKITKNDEDMTYNLRKRLGKELPIDKPEPSTKYGRMLRKDHGNNRNVSESSEEMLTDSEDNTIPLKPAPKTPERQLRSSERGGNQNKYSTHKVVQDSGDEVKDQQCVVLPKNYSERIRKSKSFTKQITSSESESPSDVKKVHRTSRPVSYRESESTESGGIKNYSLRNKQERKTEGNEPAVKSPVRERNLRKSSQRRDRISKDDLSESSSSEEKATDSKGDAEVIKATATTAEKEKQKVRVRKYSKPGKLADKDEYFPSSSDDEFVDLHQATKTKYPRKEHLRPRRIQMTSSEDESDDEVGKVRRVKRNVTGKESETLGCDEGTRKYSLRKRVRANEDNESCNDSTSSRRILRKCPRRSERAVKVIESESSERMLTDDDSEVSGFKTVASTPKNKARVNNLSKIGSSSETGHFPSSSADDQVPSNYANKRSHKSTSNKMQIASSDSDGEDVHQKNRIRPSTASKEHKSPESDDGTAKKNRLRIKEGTKSGVDDSSPSTRVLRKSLRSYHDMEGHSSESSEKIIESEEDANELKTSTTTSRKELKSTEVNDDTAKKNKLRIKEGTKSGVDDSYASTRVLRKSLKSYHDMEGHSSESSEEITESEEDAHELKATATASNQKRYPNKYLNLVKPKNISSDAESVENRPESSHSKGDIEHRRPIRNLKSVVVCITRIQVNGNCKAPDKDRNRTVPSKEVEDGERDRSTVTQPKVSDSMEHNLPDSSDEDLPGSESAEEKLHSGHKISETEKSGDHHEPCASENDDPPNASFALKHHPVTPPDSELISSPKDKRSLQNTSSSEDSVRKKTTTPEKSPNLSRRKQILPLDSDDDDDDDDDNTAGSNQQKPVTTELASAEVHMDAYDDTDMASANDAIEKPMEILAEPSVTPSQKITSKRKVGIKDALKELELSSGDELSVRRRLIRKKKHVIYDSDVSCEESEAIPQLVPIAADIPTAVNAEATEVFHSGQIEPIPSAIPKNAFFPNLTDDEEQRPQEQRPQPSATPDSETESIGAICRFLNVTEPSLSPPVPLLTTGIAKDQVPVAEHSSRVVTPKVLEENGIIEEADVTDNSKLDGTDDVDAEKPKVIAVAQTCDVEHDSDTDKILDEESVVAPSQDSCHRNVKVVLRKLDDTPTSPQRKDVHVIEDSDSSMDTEIFPLESHLKSLESSDVGNCSGTDIIPEQVEDILVVGSDVLSETVELGLNVCEEVCESGDGNNGEQEQTSNSVGDLFERDDNWEICSEYSFEHNAGEPSSAQLGSESESKGTSTSRISPSGNVQDAPYNEEKELLRLTTLKRYIREAGLNILFSSLFHEDDNTREKSKKLVKVLRDNGLTGEITLLKCRAIKKQRERKNTSEPNKEDQDAVSSSGSRVAHRIYSSSGIFRTSPNTKPASNI